MAKVFLNAGHGGSDPGAVAYGLKEKEINLATALECERILRKHGVEVVQSRNNDETEELYEIVNEAIKSKADLFVSIHANAGGGDGFEGFYWSTSSNGKRLVQLAEKYVKELGQNSRGAKVGDRLYVIKNTPMTAVLFESFFLDNDKDNDIGDTKEEQKAFGVAYAKAILEYLGIKYVEETPVVKNEYTQTQFVKDLQRAIGAQVDGIAGPETLSKTPTLSSSKNASHAAVKPVQKILAAMGYAEVGTADGVAGPKFTSAVAHFQQKNGCYVDGEITARNLTWKKLLKLA